jgi:hypothetical protein
MGLSVTRAFVAVLSVSLATLAGLTMSIVLAAGEVEKPTGEYAQAMRALAVVANELPKRLEADDRDGLNKLVIDARPPLAVLDQYWTKRGVEDAIGFAQAASKAIAEISVAVHLMENGPNPLATEGAAESIKNFKAACASCHKAYRETLPDGTFAIR